MVFPTPASTASAWAIATDDDPTPAEPSADPAAPTEPSTGADRTPPPRPAAAPVSRPVEPRIDAPRLPLDLLVHLSALVERFRAAYPLEKGLHAVLTGCRRALLRHWAGPDAARRHIEEGLAAIRAIKAASPDDVARAETVGRQLLAALPGPGRGFSRAQLQDNPHGRVFDSLVAQALVLDPPDEVVRLVDTMCAAYLADLSEDPLAGAALHGLCIGWRDSPRAWMPAAPGFAELIEGACRDAGEARSCVSSYLGKSVLSASGDDPAGRGLDVIARTYFLIALSVARAREPWTDARADAGLDDPVNGPLDFIRHSTVRVAEWLNPVRPREPREGADWPSRGIGITLMHQPVAADHPRLISVERPATTCRPGIPDMEGRRWCSALIDAQHVRGLPFATGVSGCTSVLLHLFASQRDRRLLGSTASAASAGDALLAAAMTLTYDGGHSLFESFWTGQRMDSPLTLGLGLVARDDTDPGDAGDYERMTRAFQPSTADAFRRATTDAWRGTIRYFERHHRAARDLPSPPAASAPR